MLKNSDCFEAIKEVPDNSVHCAILDPPYNIDGMGLDWNHDKLAESASKATTVKGMPVGMAFNRE